MDRAAAYFNRALVDLSRRFGVERGELSDDDIVALVRASERCADPFREANAELAGLPVRVAEGKWFWRLTAGASVWLDEVERMFPQGSRDPRYRLAIVYACGNAREPAAFQGLDSPSSVEKAVKAYCKGLAATAEEIDAALETVFRLRSRVRRADRDESLQAASDWAALAARLETQTGIAADEWMWRRSGAYMTRCYHDLHTFARAYSAAMGRSSEPMRDELDEALEALQLVKAAIAKRVKAAKTNKPANQKTN
jgi:hypothetical protein